MNFFGKYFKTALLFIIFLEILSFFGYLLPQYNQIAFFIIAFVTLILALTRLEFGLYILLAELFIGSKGYLFYFESDGLIVSIRMALFLIIMAVWLVKWFCGRRCEEPPLQTEATKQSLRLLRSLRSLAMTNRWYLILFIFLAWGFIFGLIRGNSFQNVFFDFNGWLYFALIFPLLTAIKSREQAGNILQVLMAAALWLSLKSLFILFIMGHDYRVVAPPLYQWVRNTGVGEITMITPFFSRIFFQSQIYVLIALFILLAQFIIIKWQSTSRKNVILLHCLPRGVALRGFIVILLASILISFSRSFWLGLLVTLSALFLYLVIWLGYNLKDTLRTITIVLIIGVMSVLLISAVIKFPWPPKFAPGVSFASMLEERATAITGEAGVSSRWALLPPLMKEIASHPVIGSGFGTTVTYESSDPRILAATARGYNLYTTYAFEWGYLDIWLKIGLAGLMVYLILIWKIWQQGWRLLNSKFLPAGRHGIIHNSVLILGLLLGLIVIVVTNGVSPYLNHPLGIGYLILCSVIFEIFKKEEKIFTP